MLSSEHPEIVFVLERLASNGLFASSITHHRSGTSFLAVTLSSIQLHLSNKNYAKTWQTLTSSLSPSTQRQIIGSLLGHLRLESPTTASAIKSSATLCQSLFGELGGDNGILSTLTGLISGRVWSESIARVMICWSARSDKRLSGMSFFTASQSSFAKQNIVISKLLDHIVEIWSSPDHIKHSLLSNHQCEPGKSLS